MGFRLGIMSNKLYRYCVGIGNLFIKTPFYTVDDDDDEEEYQPPKKIDTSDWARPEGINPSAALD